MVITHRVRWGTIWVGGVDGKLMRNRTKIDVDDSSESPRSAHLAPSFSLFPSLYLRTVGALTNVRCHLLERQ